jgi:tetratricopeptide (TPR) repeat protein
MDSISSKRILYLIEAVYTEKVEFVKKELDIIQNSKYKVLFKVMIYKEQNDLTLSKNILENFLKSEEVNLKSITFIWGLKEYLDLLWLMDLELEGLSYINDYYDDLIKFASKDILLNYFVNEILVTFANFYARIGEIKEANSIYEILLSKRDGLHDITLAKVYNNIGGICRLKGSIEEALSYFHSALEICQQINLKFGMHSIYFNIGLIYFYKKRYDLALDNYARSMNLKQDLKIFSNSNAIYFVIFILLLEVNSKQMISEYFNNDVVKLLRLDCEVCDFDELSQILLGKMKLNAELSKMESTFYKLAEIKQLTSRKKVSHKIEAIPLLEDLLDRKLYNNELIINAIKQLCELYILEAQATNSNEIIDLVELNLTKYLNAAIEQNLYPHQVDAYILKSKIALVKGKVPEAMEFLNEAKNVTEDNQLLVIKENLMNEYQTFVDHIEQWEKIIFENETIASKLERTGFMDYLKRVQYALKQY